MQIGEVDLLGRSMAIVPSFAVFATIDVAPGQLIKPLPDRFKVSAQSDEALSD
jgi:hypothetical protein